MKLRDDQLERYLHHLSLKDIAGEGQRRLLASKVLIVGVGGLGSPAALYLAAAGVGTLGLLDDDRVELSNLQRQIVHSMRDLGQHKVLSAQEKLTSLNPDTQILTHAQRLTEGNAEALFADYDFIIDATDNFPTKFLINDTCVCMHKPYSHGGVVSFQGQTFTYHPGSLCLRCLFPEPPEEAVTLTCRGAGILGSVAGIIGSIQATEAIKYILQKGELLTNKLLSANALTMEFRSISFNQNPQCPVCNSGKSLPAD